MFHIIKLEKGEACHKVNSNNRRGENQMWGRGERGNERGETANEMSFLSLFCFLFLFFLLMDERIVCFVFMDEKQKEMESKFFFFLLLFFFYILRNVCLCPWYSNGLNTMFPISL